MASIVYPLLLFLFIFGATATFLNSADLYEHQLPDSGLASNSSDPTELNEAMMSATDDQTSFSFRIFFLLGECIAGGILAIVTLGPLLISYGVPESMAAYAISPLGLILLFWIFEMWLGRAQE